MVYCIHYFIHLFSYCCYRIPDICGSIRFIRRKEEIKETAQGINSECGSFLCPIKFVTVITVAQHIRSILNTVIKRKCSRCEQE